MIGFLFLFIIDDWIIFIWGRIFGIFEGEVKGFSKVIGEDLGFKI